jgi:hypothetical protein
VNGEDLRPLAERAWSLEDRTPARLAEVHARIADARHRRRSTAGVISVASVLALLALTFVVVDATTNRGTPDPAPTPPTDPSQSLDPTPAPADAVHRPIEGTCWAVPPESAADPDYWHDDSTQVPCGQAHTTETVSVLALAEPTRAEAERRAVEICAVDVAAYLGIDPRGWIPWGSAALLPSAKQIADGASWVRCDAVFPESPAWERARITTGSARGVADDPPPDYWACLDQPPTTIDQPFVPCARPHAYEQTGRIARLVGLDEYPSETQLAAAEQQCRSGMPGRLHGSTVDVLWDPPEEFVPGDDLFGVCVAHDPDGDPLPARPPDEGRRS